MTNFIFPPHAQIAAPVIGTDSYFPVRRVYCIGRNYADHAIEMGHDPSREDPFFFQKNPNNLNFSAEFPYPARSTDVHHEVELAVALRAGGRDIAVHEALNCVFGYAVALDMTRRDLQGIAKKAGRPWEIGKAVEHSAPIGPIHPVGVVGHLAAGAIGLMVNGQPRQSGDLAQLIWSVPEMIAYLSQYFELAAGDVILTGTPAGVGPVVTGDVMLAEISGLPPLQVTVV
jgi:fumarylpyruvate hydrolase